VPNSEPPALSGSRTRADRYSVADPGAAGHTAADVTSDGLQRKKVIVPVGWDGRPPRRGARCQIGSYHERDSRAAWLAVVVIGGVTQVWSVPPA